MAITQTRRTLHRKEGSRDLRNDFLEDAHFNTHTSTSSPPASAHEHHDSEQNHHELLADSMYRYEAQRLRSASYPTLAVKASETVCSVTSWPLCSSL
ncbi:hypothetical protein CVT26_003426 [Gymnopilus dilepis]|uniref:Uncharacterized protein n=1 Tax=Gymnopilus dilepis TaxID=231916 RepID=A0A409Y5G2_9AGAR|nr:hypothetical protein CVT26_003426 [Gymnopilus dilepis]